MRSLFMLCVITLWGLCISSCNWISEQETDNSKKFIEENISFSAEQYSLMISILEESEKILNPRTFVNGKMVFISPQDWTSGFFPGSLWYLYELTGDDKWRECGIKYTETLDTIQYHTSDHDVGFIIGCSYGNALRLTGNEDYKKVIIQTAKSLSTRFNPTVGLIQSWNAAPFYDWQYPVIIDNMMNLEILFDATEFLGDSTFYHIAVSHADNTIKNHYRPDYSTWHVIDYNPEDGSVRHRNTHQGYSHDSSWSRGQSWSIYGYVMCYRKTKDPKYLTQAENVADYIYNHPNYPEDGVPYWDFDAPDIPNTSHDASAGSILASALYELSLYSDKLDYKIWADNIMYSLSGPDYRAQKGENGNFILMYSVGSLPGDSEVDVPLNYADYYFLEALKRKYELEK